MSIKTINPATGQLLQEYAEMSLNKIKEMIHQSQQAYQAWRQESLAARTEYLQKLEKILLKNKNDYAILMAKEMGKPVRQGNKEIEKCAWLCRYYAENAENFLRPKFIKTEMQKSYVAYEPTGIILMIMPWNFPFWQVFRAAVPNIVAGNVTMLSHAPITTGSGLAIEQLFLAAGFPKGVFQTIMANYEVMKNVIEHPLIRGVTLTGSERAGKAVGSEAGNALKKVVLELGGNDPYIILEDADLEKAATAIVSSRMNNSGQVCIAAKRVIALEPVYDRLLSLIKDKLIQYQMGDPLREETNFGPLARADLRETAHEQVQKSVKQGAKLLLGGVVPTGNGFYYPPTLLANVTPGMTAYEEEIFGPVISVIRVQNEEQAIAMANDSEYGLSAAVFSRDIQRAEKMARDSICAGTVCVNDYVASDPRLPFGGTKNSGHGREMSDLGMYEFLNIKTISVR